MISKTAYIKSSGIYKIQSIKNNKIYVGSAVNIKKRIFNDHIKQLEENRHGNRFLQRHFNKYGINCLIFKVIEFCPKEKLIEREQYWINKLNPEFNICKIAGSSLGIKHSKIFGNKISKTRKSLFKTKEGKVISDKMQVSRNIFLKTDEGQQWKEKQSKIISKLATSKLTEVKQKMSESQQLFYSSNEGKIEKENRIQRQKDNWKSPEYRKRNIEGRRKFWESKEGQLRRQNLKNEKLNNYYFKKSEK